MKYMVSAAVTMNRKTIAATLKRLYRPGPDRPGFSGAGEGVHTCLADSIATRILGLRA
jgi:hypothetical protein